MAASLSTNRQNPVGNSIGAIEVARDNSTIEVVRGRLDPASAAELFSFWAAQGAPSAEAMERRLPDVVCVLRRRGEIAGSSSVFAEEVGLIGGRRFWIYRSLLDQGVADQAPAMLRATFNALEAEFDGAAGSPIGLCVVLAGEAERRQRPEAEWSDPRATYAGYLPDDRQLRIAYFEDADIAPRVRPPVSPEPTPIPSGYRIDLFAAQSHVSARDVVELWTREGVLQPEAAARRAAEIVSVATDAEHRPVGVCTASLRRNEQLRAELWYLRAFVAPAHRRSGLAEVLARAADEHLVERYRSGANRRGIGVLFQVESDILKRFFPEAVWPRMPFTFIGEDDHGSHIRVHYFPGALAPEPARPQGTELPQGSA